MMNCKLKENILYIIQISIRKANPMSIFEDFISFGYFSKSTNVHLVSGLNFLLKGTNSK
jgi:hypothetical protein